MIYICPRCNAIAEYNNYYGRYTCTRCTWENKFLEDTKMLENKLFTSESVTEGHPDKVCDMISDAILSAHLAGDPDSRVACECFAGHNFMLISGEITSKCNVDYEKVARDTIRKIGYTDKNDQFNADGIEVLCRVNSQSPDIALGVDVGGAGDQGMMFGYACNETPDLMPAPIQYAHALTKQLTKARRSNPELPFRPDGKSQVTVVYDRDGKVSKIDTILISTQHPKEATLDEVRDAVVKYVINAAIPSELITPDTKILVNPTGRFVIGGPEGDTGLTGRKIIVDTYGGMGRHGGGAFSGKDPTKVDRSAAYMARHIAKSIVGNELAKRCEVELAYAIGIAEPVAVYVDTFGTGVASDEALAKLITKTFDLTPAGIIDYLDLKYIDYTKVAAYGHMGRTDLNMPWEAIAVL